jgi:predicted phosphodiesterase
VRLLGEYPPEGLEAEALRAGLGGLRDEVGAALGGGGGGAGLVAAGGSIDILADLAAVPRDSRGARTLSRAALHDLIDRLAGLSIQERVEMLGLTPDRADVILHGAITYEQLAEAAGADDLLVPGVGVRDGILLDLADSVARRREAASPTRVAFLSDIHANVLGLRAAIEEAEGRGAGQIVAAGDYVGDGPHPREVVRMLRRTGVPAIRGNVDRKVMKLAGKKRKKLLKRLEKAPRSRVNRVWTALELRADGGEEEMEWLDALPVERRLEIGGKKVLVVHGSPLADNDRIFSSLTPLALDRKLAPVSDWRPDLLVCGHTHAPFVASVDGVLVANCGSAGHPADGDPRGALVIAELGESPPRAEVVRFEYPVDALVADLADGDVPGLDADQFRDGTKT